MKYFDNLNSKDLTESFWRNVKIFFIERLEHVVNQ